MLLRRPPQPADERVVKHERIDDLEVQARAAQKAGEAALRERRVRLAAAVDDSSRAMRRR